MKNLAEIGSGIERFTGAPSLYAGGSLRSLSSEKRWGIADVVSRKLEDNKHKMIRYSAYSLVQAINEGRAACILDADQNLTSFAQYWPYEVDHAGDDFLTGLNVFEIGSWLRFDTNGEKNHGRKVFEACLEIGNMAHPHAGFIAIVEDGNTRASEILESMGGQKIGNKESKRVKDLHSKPAKMSIYRMLNPGGGR